MRGRKRTILSFHAHRSIQATPDSKDAKSVQFSFKEDPALIHELSLRQSTLNSCRSSLRNYLLILKQNGEKKRENFAKNNAPSAQVPSTKSHVPTYDLVSEKGLFAQGVTDGTAQTAQTVIPIPRQTIVRSRV